MIFMQIILIVVGIILLIKVLSNRSTYAIRAWKKIAIIALLALMIIGVIYPDLVSVVASWVGVGRGTDLLLYILFVVFLFYVLGQYVRSQDDRDKTVRLARKVAILDAKNKYGVK